MRWVLHVAGVIGAAPGGFWARRPLQSMQLGNGGGPAHGQRVEDGVALFGRGGQRVANDSAGAEVARAQAQAGRPSGESRGESKRAGS